MTSPVEGTPLNAAYGHVIAARGRDHVEVVTPTIDRPLRSRPVAPVGSPKIPESEVGEIGSKFPGVSQPGSSVDAATFHRWHSSLPNSQLDGPYRRSRSLNRLAEVQDVTNSQTYTNLTAYDTMREIYQRHAHEDRDNEEQTSDNQDDETAELNSGIRERVSPVQASRTPPRRAQLTLHGSYESFQAFLEDTFSDADSEEVRPRVNSGVATLALYDTSGLVVARPVSQEGLENVESNIIRHLGARSNVSLVSDQTDAHREVYGDMIRPQGRLSIEYDPEAFSEGFVQPSSSRSSSSISYATYHLRAYGYDIGEEPGSGGPPYDQVFGVPRTRTGTPPLLFGSHAIGQASHPVVSTTNEADAERDWETVDDMSRQETWTTQLQGTVSSRADYSSSSSGMRNRGLPAGGQQLQPPSHPRYVRSWNISRDERTGQTVLLPENDTGASRLIRPYISTPSSARSRFFNNYHHPSPLSEGQEQLLNTSPLSLEPEDGSVSAQGLVSLPRRRPALNLSLLPHDVEAARELASDPIAFSCDDSSVLEMVSMSKRARKDEHQESSRKDHSSAWVSTEETANDEDFVQQHAPEGSFADFFAGGPRGNVTGTPQGTGAREVGSSLANASSPYERLLSSPPMEEAPVDGAPKKKTLHEQTIGGSLDTISTTSSGALFRDLHRIPSSEYSQYSQDQDLTALPVFSSEFQSELYEHKQNLISAGILDPPPGAGPTRRSGPRTLLAPIKDATASTGAALGRQFHRLPIIPALAPFRQRSPQRRAAPQDLTPTEPGPSNTLSQSNKMKASHPNKDARKRKVSDSEESIDAAPNQRDTSRNTYLLATATGPQRASVTTSAEPVPLEGVAIHPTTTANHGDRGHNPTLNAHRSRPVMATASNGFVGQATMSSNLGGQATLSNIPGGQTASSSNTNTTPTVRPYFGTAQHLHRVRGQVGEEWELLYRDALGDGNSASEVLRSIQPVRRPVPPPGYSRRNLPRAREESPHFHRIPRLVDHQENLRYQKTFSQVALILCFFCPPLWLAYGLGYLDGVIAWVTDGDIKNMRQAEKKLALVLASAVAVVAVAGIVAAIYFSVSGR